MRVSPEDAHKQFEELLNRVRPSADKLYLFKVILLRHWNDEFRHMQNERRSIDIKLKDNEDQKNAIIQKNLKGVLDDETMKDQLDRIAIRKAELTIERTGLRNGELDKEEIIDYAIKFITDAAAVWREATLDNKQRFQRMIFPKGIKYDFSIGFGTAEISPLYRFMHIQKGANAPEKSSMVIPRGFEPRLPG